MGRHRRWLRFLGFAIATAMSLPLLLNSVAVPVRSSPAATVVAQADNLDDQLQLADDQFYSRDYANAEQNYRMVLEQLQQTDPTSLDLPLVTHSLARTYLLTEQYDQALPLLQSLDASGSATNNALNNLALAHFNLGNYSAAEQVLTRVIARWDDIRSGDDLGDLDKVTLFEQQSHSYDLLQRTLVAQGKTEAALAISERSRAQALVELLIQQQRRDRVPPPLTVAQMQAVARQENTILVVYATPTDGRRILGNEVSIETDVFSWVISPQGQVQFKQVPLQPFWQETGLRSGPANALSPLENLVQQTRTALGVESRGLGVVPVERRVTDDLPPSNPLPLRSLYDILIAPIEPWLPSDPNALVTFMPQGSLFLVPFAALQSPAGKYLVDDHAIALAPSVQTLALATQVDGTASDSLVVGNPVTMPTLELGLNTAPQALPPLPGAEREAIAIADLLQTTPLIREQATETAIVQRLPQQGIIHLATHGILNLDSRLNEFGLPVDLNAPTAADADVYVNPGAVIVGDNVYVGNVDADIALARERVVRVSAPGVLALAPSSTDDGWLTAEEIAGLDLQADLVILSACDTGRGRITGDGVVGLTRSFLAAGADTIVVSLWQVPDNPTAALMIAFYEQMAQVPNKALALQKAMQITKQQFPDPRNWSAFVLVGEGR
ncbi:MAG: CHAT domain-containing tetratricopeptide repeat protein [Cyanobacteria bacterium J06638_28]